MTDMMPHLMQQHMIPHKRPQGFRTPLTEPPVSCLFHLHPKGYLYRKKGVDLPTAHRRGLFKNEWFPPCRDMDGRFLLVLILPIVSAVGMPGGERFGNKTDRPQTFPILRRNLDKSL